MSCLFDSALESREGWTSCKGIASDIQLSWLSARLPGTEWELLPLHYVLRVLTALLPWDGAWVLLPGVLGSPAPHGAPAHD